MEQPGKLIQTATPVAKSRIFLLTQGGIRNSIYSNEIIDTNDLVKMITKLGLDRKTIHQILTAHTASVQVPQYTPEQKEKLSVALINFQKMYKDAYKDSLEDADDQTRKNNIQRINESKDLTIYDKLIYMLVEESLYDDDDDERKIFVKRINVLVTIVFKFSNSKVNKTRLREGDILAYLGEETFAVEILKNDGFQYYPLMYQKEVGMVISMSRKATINEADIFFGTYIDVLNSEVKDTLIDTAAEMFKPDE